ncbi:hypothetical protein MN608_11410 [Microdochium nivale]|nr:hypothetical protein MN608_11410 [Microdochium nivale]
MAQALPMTTPAQSCIIAGWILWVLGATIVYLRCLARVRGAGLGADDYLSVVSTILTSVAIGIAGAVFTSGVGYDMFPDSPVYPILTGNLQRILELTFAYTLIYIWALGALKLSQLFLYLRTFSVQLRGWILGGIIMVVAWGVAFTLVFVFLCDPVKQQWTLERIGKCIDQITVLKALILTNVVTDLFIVVLPVRTVWELQMRKTEKVVVLLCFSMGLACCIIGVVRFIYLFEIDLLGNLTGTSQTTFILVTVELVLAVLCINLPTLRPYYLRFRAKYGSYWTSSCKNNNDENNNNYSNTGLGESHELSYPSKTTSSFAGAMAAMTTGKKNKNDDMEGSKYAAWIELNDTEHGATSDDAESERKLTGATSGQLGTVMVCKDWEVTRD